MAADREAQAQMVARAVEITTLNWNDRTTVAAYGSALVHGHTLNAKQEAHLQKIIAAAGVAPTRAPLTDDEIDKLQEQCDCFGCDCCDIRIHEFARAVEAHILGVRVDAPVATLRVTEGEGGLDYDVWLGEGMWSVTKPGDYPLTVAAGVGAAPAPDRSEFLAWARSTHKLVPVGVRPSCCDHGKTEECCAGGCAHDEELERANKSWKDTAGVKEDRRG